MLLSHRQAASTNPTFPSDENSASLTHSSRRRPLKLSHEAMLHRLARARSSATRCANPVISTGWPTRSAPSRPASHPDQAAHSFRMTRALGGYVSAANAIHSRAEIGLSETKSNDHHRFGPTQRHWPACAQRPSATATATDPQPLNQYIPSLFVCVHMTPIINTKRFCPNLHHGTDQNNRCHMTT